MSETYPEHVRAAVITLRTRGYGWPTIIAKVRKRFAASASAITEAEAQNIWARSRPRDTRTLRERAAVPITLPGPAWSHPKRSAG